MTQLPWTSLKGNMPRTFCCNTFLSCFLLIAFCLADLRLVLFWLSFRRIYEYFGGLFVCLLFQFLILPFHSVILPCITRDTPCLGCNSCSFYPLRRNKGSGLCANRILGLIVQNRVEEWNPGHRSAEDL